MPDPKKATTQTDVGMPDPKKATTQTDVGMPEQFKTAQELVAEFEKLTETFANKKQQNVDEKVHIPVHDFHNLEFQNLQRSMPWITDEAVSEAASKFSDETMQKACREIAEKSRKIGAFLDFCERFHSKTNSEVSFTSPVQLHKYNPPYIPSIEFVHSTPSGVEAKMTLRDIAAMAVFQHLIETSKEKKFLDRIPASEKDLSSNDSEIKNLEKALKVACVNDSEKQQKLTKYFKDWTLFKSIQIVESEDGRLRATVANKLYEDFGLTPPQRTAPQKSEPQQPTQQKKPMGMGSMGF